MSIQSIEERIIEKAMIDMKAEIDGYLKPFVNIINPNYYKEITCDCETHGSKQSVTLKQQGFVFQILRQILVNELTEPRKKQALDAFMAKINQLSRAYEELGIYQEENQ